MISSVLSFFRGLFDIPSEEGYGVFRDLPPEQDGDDDDDDDDATETAPAPDAPPHPLQLEYGLSCFPRTCRHRLNRVSLLSRREAKLILVYLHSPSHTDTSDFVTEFLGNREVCALIDSLFLFVVLHVQSPEGYTLAGQLEATSYPFLAILVSSYTRQRRMTLECRLEGRDIMFPSVGDNLSLHEVQEEAQEDEEEEMRIREGEGEGEGEGEAPAVEVVDEGDGDGEGDGDEEDRKKTIPRPRRAGRVRIFMRCLKLLHDRFYPQLISDRAAMDLVEENRHFVATQDRDYEESLARDRERDRLERQGRREEIRLEEEEARRRESLDAVARERELWRHEFFEDELHEREDASLYDVDSDSDPVPLTLKFPTGERLQRTFRSTDKILQLHKLILCLPGFGISWSPREDARMGDYALETTFPKKTLDPEMTLDEAQVRNSLILVVEQ